MNDQNIYRQATDQDSPIENVHILAFEPLEAPEYTKQKIPTTPEARLAIRTGRTDLRNVLAGNDERFVVIAGPCSIHDANEAMDYAHRLAPLRDKYADRMIIVMRVYFEKPRTTIGWKGLINDPFADGSNNVHHGITTARDLLIRINSLGLPCATEFLDPIIPQYIADQISWAAIGARTTESQTHREMASGLSMPVGFKNATDGGLQVAINAIQAGRAPQAFLGIDEKGQTAVVRTGGNTDVHIVLRGGSNGPNYSPADVAQTLALLKCPANERRILVDCSHGNSNKDYRLQSAALHEVVGEFVGGQRAIMGVMLESNLAAGQQALHGERQYGVSVTDACIGWEETESLIHETADQLPVV
jgi:3-deoxy-7-phosphoheptulonate synthase